MLYNESDTGEKNGDVQYFLIKDKILE